MRELAPVLADVYRSMFAVIRRPARRAASTRAIARSIIGQFLRPVTWKW